MGGPPSSLRLAAPDRIVAGSGVGRPAFLPGREVETGIESDQLKKVTSKERIKRQMRVSAMLSMRLQGASLQQIGEAYGISFQAVHQAIKSALKNVAVEPLEQIRSMEVLRLDELLAGIYEMALGGDIAAIDRCLAIMYRRARMLGLDLQPGGGLRFGPNGYEEVDAQTVRIEIVNDPEWERVRWLESERERLLAGETPPPTTRVN
jgi:hypothetical protein